MNSAPWTYIGWALLVILVIGAIVAVIVGIVALRNVRHFQREWRETERFHKEIRDDIARGGRPASGRFKL